MDRLTDDAAAGDKGPRAVDLAHSSPIPSFRVIYREHFQFAWANLLRLGVPTASVEDALQDVFFTVHRRRHAFGGRSSVRTWVFGIVRRVAFRYRRTAQRVDRKHRAVAKVVPTPTSIDDALERRQLGALLLRALDSIDEDKRAALVLHVFDDLSGPQIAEMLNLPVDTVYSRIKAGRRGLKRRLVAMGVANNHEQLVAAARNQTQPKNGARRRVAALLAVRLGADGVAKTASVTAVWKGLAITAGLGVVAMAGLRAASTAPEQNPTAVQTRSGRGRDTLPPGGAVRPSHALPPTDATLPREPEVGRPASESQPDPGAQRAAPNRSPAIESGTGGPPPPSSGLDEDPTGTTLALTEEVRLVEAVRRALDRADRSEALRRLSEHARRFPTGQLRTERAAYRAIALCELGRAVQGRGEARLFVTRHPESTLVGRVTAACALVEKRAREP